MIRLQLQPLASVEDARSMLQTAIGVEFGTLPPYLYALYSIPPGDNGPASARFRSVALQEMIHMCLACNMPDDAALVAIPGIGARKLEQFGPDVLAMVQARQSS